MADVECGYTLIDFGSDGTLDHIRNLIAHHHIKGSYALTPASSTLTTFVVVHPYNTRMVI
mgnify:FL=1